MQPAAVQRRDVHPGPRGGWGAARRPRHSGRACSGGGEDAAGLIIHSFPRPDWLRGAERSRAPLQEETPWP